MPHYKPLASREKVSVVNGVEVTTTEITLDPNGENMDNINILALDYEDEQRNIQEIENDVFGLQGIPEDYDAGEFDDNDWHGGSD